MKEPDLKDLLNNCVVISRLNIPRLSILNLQLYVEHYVNEIVLTQIGDAAKDEVKKYITFPQKLRVLKNMNIIDEKQVKILEVLNKIRDEIVHELVFEPETIEAKLKFTKFDFVYGWAYIDSKGEKVNKIIDLKNVFKKIDNNFRRLSISTVLIIGILYNQCKNIKNEKVNQFIDMIVDDKFNVKFVVREI